jgi:hypothetical protein
MAANQLKMQQPTESWCRWGGQVRNETRPRWNIWGQQPNVIWGSKLDDKNEENEFFCGLKWPPNNK